MCVFSFLKSSEFFQRCGLTALLAFDGQPSRTASYYDLKQYIPSNEALTGQNHHIHRQPASLLLLFLNHFYFIFRGGTTRIRTARKKAGGLKIAVFRPFQDKKQVKIIRIYITDRHHWMIKKHSRKKNRKNHPPKKKLGKFLEY